jgi:hypothetical protein
MLLEKKIAAIYGAGEGSGGAFRRWLDVRRINIPANEEQYGLSASWRSDHRLGGLAGAQAVYCVAASHRVAGASSHHACHSRVRTDRLPRNRAATGGPAIEMRTRP